MAVPYHQQAEIEALIAGDKKRAKEFADQDPDQKQGETRNILRKEKNYDASAGKVIKTILRDGVDYRTPNKNAEVQIKYKIGFVTEDINKQGLENMEETEVKYIHSSDGFSFVVGQEQVGHLCVVVSCRVVMDDEGKRGNG